MGKSCLKVLPTAIIILQCFQVMARCGLDTLKCVFYDIHAPVQTIDYITVQYYIDYISSLDIGETFTIGFNW